MKKLAVILVIVLVLVVGILVQLVFSTKNATQPAPVPAANTSAPAAENIPTVSNLPTASAKEFHPSSLNSPASISSPATTPADTNQVPVLPPTTVLDNARVVMHNYQSAFGENPVGDNAEITAALMGKNPKQINFIREDTGLRVNEKGELLDGYGTPFFFHQISGKLMEIHSAGMDRKLWTFDDQVTR
jgi:hypothetical protein